MSLKKGSTLSISVQACPDSLATPLDLDSKPKDFFTIKDFLVLLMLRVFLKRKNIF